MSFNVGLSGLNAANTALNVTGNNIANSATTGFKSSRAEFGDVYANSLFLGSAKNGVGSGVTTEQISQQFTQGTITNTGASLDLAINGNGFFITSDNGSRVYTRAGAFGTDKAGNIVDANNNQLLGYGVDADGKVIQGVMTPLKVDTSALAPKPTDTLSETMNLNSSSAAPSVTPFSASDTNTYNYSFSTDIYDSQGNSHSMTQYFVKTGTNSWSMYATVDGVNPSDPSSTEPYQVDMTFSSSGALATATPVTPTVGKGFTVSGTGKFLMDDWTPSAKNAAGVMVPNGSAQAAGGLNLNMADTTSYNTSSAVTAKDQNGYATGSLSSLSIDAQGNLFGTYSNGKSKTIGQVVLANFANVQGLTPNGNTGWRESAASGVPVVGTPESGTMGTLNAGALEESNVDLTAELVNLIKAQSNYQANAKTISTESTIMQTIIQMT
ncbi:MULTISPECIES: flagellar hook protein FlgE [unclassified Pseudomonas]|uniref:flagellar hook protein FlgE n=1 Tax=unclassified Pseudomonas TaxID=196821 RepID=UPI000BD88416|nr:MULTISPECIES: flagellar hook protein FlgE [unclassified Pseudomonas]PVZ13746.1 flagellar hook protein FlgE [Pseudomonas sp. URIL14HWK12:I12]PVZ24052.1 flagellar hook protein FlgE [Pseudomonas sp. URIL14HWK12:I10]PVZ33309.1 flagellar hook protein FlgE [Pseudomonas sp. URIL14HWK12:I11]SNZ11102.1 flagellar hook protein FlgE [Pseudomonas sp. URIL14HWK12:I9]